MGDRVQLGAAVREIVHKADSVVVRYRQDGIDREVEARYVVLATPGPDRHQLAVDLHGDVREALGKVVYGPLVSAAFLTERDRAPVVGRRLCIAAPKRSFDVALNHASIVPLATERHQAAAS